MTPTEKILCAARDAGMPKDQIVRYLTANFVPQPRQMMFSAACRAADDPDGPTMIGTGGARGGGKSTIMLGQAVIDDCQRFDNLKVLWLRKVGKANLEHLDDMRRSVLKAVPHSFRRNDGTITVGNAGSRVICGHFQNENDIDSYLGVEYDIVALEEATTLQESKFRNIRTCLRSSKAGWRPRLYTTFNPGGIGHGWVKKTFIDPWRRGREVDTRFISSRCTDNSFNNPEYIKVLESLTGWQRRAWLEGDWDITAGQFFTNWREDKHVMTHFDDRKGMSWFAALDYGFRHWTVCLLACVTGDGQIVVVDCYRAREQNPGQNTVGIKAMMTRHGITDMGMLDYFVAGSDIFATESDGASVAAEYALHGINLTVAEMDRVNGWSAILTRLGDPEREPFYPKLLVHQRCNGLIERMPLMTHDPNKPEDIEKVDCDSDTGEGGDDDCFVAGTLVKTIAGDKPIESIKDSEFIWTRQGFKPGYMKSIRIKEVFEVSFSDGTKLVGSGEHPFFVNGMWVRLDCLRYDDIVMKWKQKQSYLTESSSGVIPEPKNQTIETISVQVGTILKKVFNRSIRRFGKVIMDKFQKVNISITRMETRQIILLKTWNAYRLKTIQKSIPFWEVIPHRLYCPILNGYDHFQNFGMVQKKEKNGIKNTGKKVFQKLSLRERLNAIVAVFCSKQKHPTSPPSFAVDIAKPFTESNQGSMMKKEYVHAEMGLQLINISEKDFVPVIVVQIQSFGKRFVYNLFVEEANEYLANGILVHNCDALRYLVGSFRAAQPLTRAAPLGKLFSHGQTA